MPTSKPRTTPKISVTISFAGAETYPRIPPVITDIIMNDKPQEFSLFARTKIPIFCFLRKLQIFFLIISNGL
jgi:hypothetical protein